MIAIIAVMAVALTLCLPSGCGSNSGTPAPTRPASAAETRASASESPDTASTAHNIAGYYNADGSFSDLALALEEADSGRKLDVVSGDRFIAGNHEYTVAADSFTLIFYTHPSVDSAIEWWVDYFETAADNNIVTAAG